MTEAKVDHPITVPETPPSPELDFTFAFNDPNFSDRVLRIEILPDIPVSQSDVEAYVSNSDWGHNRKRRRAETEDIVVQCEEQVLHCNMLDTEDFVVCENQDEDAMATTESPSVSLCNCVNVKAAGIWITDCSTVLRVETIHISSPILAAKSPFFYKLFSDGMKQSGLEERQATLRIHESEEAALMDLLNFIYGNTLSTTTAPSLLDVLKAADKFEVESCMRYCSRLLGQLPMTRDSALLYLDLPSSVLMVDAVQSLTDTAKKFLATRYRELTKFVDEVLYLPLAGIEAVLSSDDLHVASEDAIFDLVLKWARLHYRNAEDRQEVIASRLARLIRFPFMSCRKLRKVLSCNDFDPQLSSKIVLEALFYKSETPYRQRLLAVENANATYRGFVDRSYKYRPVKIVEFELPHPQCIVYLDLKREECARLFPAGRVYSQAFNLGGQGFFLSAHCNMDQQNSFQCLGLFLGMQEKGSVSFVVDYEFSVRVKPEEEFQSKHKGTYTFTGGKAVGYRNLLAIPWTTFMADDSIYFINSVLHLQAELIIRQ
ncbi:PREDICTED: BTB/POZ domain-containing protein At2g46260-like isoform X2 [Fragaria vesca subsp. vesca]|uniref:BTB/POZ domain-containing protein At2g46260-like isoform X2 n=1 Tax=Fragaria vesca subsp. vesca TaxID=101020 RepID=UPI0002C3360A|nr:PREDICTED: BTB/POZ domain-containing protein At2g46260-like isoform X2 [Fragaria vesca subsp. vesca]